MSALITAPGLTALARTWGTAYQPLEIRCDTATALCGYDLPHLPGLLAAAAVALATQGQGLAPSAIPYDLPLPLVCLWRDPGSGLPLWAATDFAPVGEQQRTHTEWHRYPIPAPLVQRDAKGRPVAPRPTQGPYKAMQIGLWGILARAWRATCVGDAAAIATLLPALGTHLGKKRGTGYGAVCRWQIRPLPAFTLMDPALGLLHPVPGAFLNTTDPDLISSLTIQGWTPPYWHPATQSLALARGITGVALPEGWQC